MRALKYFLITLYYSSKVFSATASLSIEQGSQTSINEDNIPYVSQILSLKDLKVNNSAQLNLSLTKIDFSDSERNLTLINGQEVPLKQFDDGLRNILELGTSIQYKNQTFNVSVSDDVKKTVFKENMVAVSDRLEFYSGATALTFTLSQSEQDQPMSYFTHPETLQGTQRASHISKTIYAVAIEQIWTETYRTEFSVYTKNTKGYRPKENGTTAKMALALNERWSYLNEIGFAQQNKTERLAEDRGYFNSFWLDQEVNYEWSLDSFVGLGWSTLDENEKDPRRNFSQHLGSDQLGVSLKQELRSWAYEIKGQYTLTSNKESSANFKGGLFWDF